MSLNCQGQNKNLFGKGLKSVLGGRVGQFEDAKGCTCCARHKWIWHYQIFNGGYHQRHLGRRLTYNRWSLQTNRRPIEGRVFFSYNFFSQIAIWFECQGKVLKTDITQTLVFGVNQLPTMLFYFPSHLLQ